MADITARMLALLRHMHAGASLTVTPKGTGALDLSKVSGEIRRPTVEKLIAEGLIAPGDSAKEFRITELGRDHVRVRDHIADFMLEETHGNS